METGKFKKPLKRKFKTAEERAADRAARVNLTPGRVTAVEPQVKRPNRYSLYIDDHFAMGLSAYVAAGVRVGQELARADLDKLYSAEQLEQARDKALSFLAVRPRSEQELRRRLAQKKYSEEIITQVIARLGDVELVNDRDFAKFWVENREGFKPRSKRALQYELRQKGVSNEEIARAVKKVDEGESAYRAAYSKALRYKELDAKTFREKLSGFLARRGFDYTVTRKTVDRLWQQVNETEQNSDQDQVWKIDA
ncbi:MAG: regulatory protein RecX [Anaerolineae bacterium]|nr:regulatory protein RecX [Anaerolineae bacterium]